MNLDWPTSYDETVRDDGATPGPKVLWRYGGLAEANALLAERHYLGSLRSGARVVVVGEAQASVVACQLWKHPTSRRLPADGSWLELARWCLTPQAGNYGGSKMHAAAVRLIRAQYKSVTTLVSYSDPSQGHTGALYRACNWTWAPTWHRLRPAPTGNGNWGSGKQHVKDRWVFSVRADPFRAEVLRINDPGAVRYWMHNATLDEQKWVLRSVPLREAIERLGL